MRQENRRAAWSRGTERGHRDCLFKGGLDNPESGSLHAAVWRGWLQLLIRCSNSTHQGLRALKSLRGRTVLCSSTGCTQDQIKTFWSFSKQSSDNSADMRFLRVWVHIEASVICRDVKKPQHTCWVSRKGQFKSERGTLWHKQLIWCSVCCDLDKRPCKNTKVCLLDLVLGLKSGLC